MTSLGRQAPGPELNLVVIRANDEENAAHEALLEKMRASGECIWRDD